MNAAYLLIAHGTRDGEGNQAFEQLLRRFRKLHPDRLVEGAYLEMAEPSVAEGIENCIRQGAREIFMLPLMLFPGRHVKEDIPRILEEARVSHPDVDFHFGGPLSEDPRMLDLLSEKVGKMKGNTV